MATRPGARHESLNFVVFQDKEAGTWSVEEFPADASDAALARLFALERHYGNSRTVGIILLGTDSLETLFYTHGDLFYGERVDPPVIPAPVGT
jgi:hypothetical protein